MGDDNIQGLIGGGRTKWVCAHKTRDDPTTTKSQRQSGNDWRWFGITVVVSWCCCMSVWWSLPLAISIFMVMLKMAIMSVCASTLIAQRLHQHGSKHCRTLQVAIANRSQSAASNFQLLPRQINHVLHTGHSIKSDPPVNREAHAQHW